MKRYISKCKRSVILAVLAAAMIIPGMVSEAKTINKKVTENKVVCTLGYERTLNNVAGLKINNKSANKYKKKIKTIVTDTHPSGFYYQTKAYFKDSDAYVQYDDYTNATENARKYVAYNDYTIRFLKTGTYTISWVEYEKEDLDMLYSTSKTVNGKTVSYYKLKDNDGKQSTELYEKKTTNGGDTYYQGVSSKKIYAETYSDGWSYVAATIKTGADKKQYVYCQPRNVIKTTYSKQYKVLKTSKVISSVQLGKTKLTRADSKSAYSSSSSSKRAFLSGSSGKLTVKAADKNYSITSIVVLTYDKEGKPVYTKVSNKKKINYGVNKSMSSYKSSFSTYSYNSVSLYKPTTVYVCYKNKFTGAFCRVNSISKNKYGNSEFSVTYRNAGDTKDTTVTKTSMPSDCTTSYTFYKK